MRSFGVALALVCLGVVTPCLATEDRDNTGVTAWYWYYGQTATQITDEINSLNLRIVDLKVENPTGSPRTFTVAFVENTGTYAKGWYWLYDVTPTQAFNFASNNNARPVVVQAYEVAPGDVRVAMVYVVNTGADQKGWWFYVNDTPADISSQVSTNSARLTQLSRYTAQGQTRYAVIMISNAGGDQKSWSWYFGITASQVGSYLTSNDARLTDLDYDSASGTYEAIMESCASGCPRWLWYYDVPASSVNAFADQQVSRIIDVERYVCGLRTCFAVVMIDDANAITTRVGDLLRNGTSGTGATTGLYLKAVGGAVLAAMEPNYIYEPASAIKIGPATLAMTRVQASTAHLTDQINHNFDGPASCPSPSDFTGTESLQTALQEMMRHSDNARTLEVITWEGGNGVVNAFLQNTVGMTSTSINQIIGCATPPDTYTLADAGLIYEKIANGTLLNATNRSTLFSVMAGKAEFTAEGYDFTRIWDTDFPNLIADEAPSQMSAANKTWWQGQANVAYKPGGYTICRSTCSDVFQDIDVTGWASLPFCSGLTLTPHEYVWGMFISNAEDTSWFDGKNTKADQTFIATKAEVLREQVRASLASCLHGDANQDGRTTVTDIFYLINTLFAGGPPPRGYADVNGDHTVNVADTIYMINYLFGNGPAPQ
jgi:hypothetical protein